MSANSHNRRCEINPGRVARAKGDPQKFPKNFWGKSARQDPSGIDFASSVVNFYGRDFLVTRDVLTPRPETEQLIDMALTLAGKPYLPGVKPTPRALPSSPKILDVGTGSGCIAITLKKELPDAEVYASDISRPAIKIAEENAKRLRSPINTIISHLLENVKFTPDLIVANLPYVDPAWPWLDKTALSSDPDLALYAKDHGLHLIKQLLSTSNSPYLLLEADPCQHHDIIAYAATHNYHHFSTMGFALGFKK